MRGVCGSLQVAAGNPPEASAAGTGTIHKGPYKGLVDYTDSSEEEDVRCNRHAFNSHWHAVSDRQRTVQRTVVSMMHEFAYHTWRLPC